MDVGYAVGVCCLIQCLSIDPTSSKEKWVRVERKSVVEV